MDKKIRFDQTRRLIKDLENRTNLPDDERELLKELKLIIRFLDGKEGIHHINESLSLAGSSCPVCGKPL